MILRLVCTLFVLLAGAEPVAAQPVEPEGIDTLLTRLEQALRVGTPPAYLELLSSVADPGRAEAFAATRFVPGATRAAVRLRDREHLQGALPGEGYRLLLEVFLESGQKGSIATWRVDIRRPRRRGEFAATLAPPPWQIADQEVMSSLEGLYRLTLNATKQFAARRFVLSAEDLTLQLSEGSVFVAEADEGVVALVLLGRGEMSFSPRPAAERGQVKIFCGKETLRTSFSQVFVRLNPRDFAARVNEEALVEQAVDPRELRRARQLFDEHIDQSLSLDLGDLSPDTWSLIPSVGDLVVEIRTRRFDTLTYARSSSEAEDISLFDRKRKRNIALYASEQRLASRGRDYDENSFIGYDVTHYSLDVAFQPEQQRVEGRARVTLRVETHALAMLTMRLADSLAITSLVSNELGHLLHLRVRGQDQFFVNLPTVVRQGTELTLEFAYSGQLAAQELEREAITVQQPGFTLDRQAVQPEPRYLYSNVSYWYPQSTGSDYATAVIRITVPAAYTSVASGELTADSPVTVARPDGTYQKLYTFVAMQPARYLSCVISRFTRAADMTVDLFSASLDAGDSSLPAGPNTAVAGVVYDRLRLGVEAHVRQRGRGRALLDRAKSVISFYTRLLGDYPYPAFTLALTDSELPGGHSPAYFGVLNQPLSTSRFTWRTDPVHFEGYPDFFLAHELAHQWWGQAVGWRNYHEQWLSEGFSQYFAALYARHDRGDATFTRILQQMRRWAMNHTEQGPISLGYRLGHIRGESRVFRALIYNKAAVVLHMLRRLIGDQAFFRGARRLYGEARFDRIGTDDVRRAFEAEAGTSLHRFFERWIHDTRLPQLTFSYRTEPDSPDPAAAVAPPPPGPAIVLRFEQTGEIFDLPVTVTLIYGSGDVHDIVVPVTDRVSEMRVRLAGDLRRVEVNRDHAALAHIRP